MHNLEENTFCTFYCAAKLLFLKSKIPMTEGDNLAKYLYCLTTKNIFKNHLYIILSLYNVETL